MNPPEKYIFISGHGSTEYYVPIWQRVVGMSPKLNEEVSRALPYILAVYRLIGQTDKGYIYEFDGFEIH